MGAPDPRETMIAQINSSISEEDIRDAKENFWAYQKPVASQPPATMDQQWPKSDIDRFVLAQVGIRGDPAGQGRRELQSAYEDFVLILSDFRRRRSKSNASRRVGSRIRTPPSRRSSINYWKAINSVNVGDDTGWTWLDMPSRRAAK